MNYSIEGGSLPAVIIQLNAGEALISEAGGRTWSRGPIVINNGLYAYTFHKNNIIYYSFFKFFTDHCITTILNYNGLSTIFLNIWKCMN